MLFPLGDAPMIAYTLEMLASNDVKQVHTLTYVDHTRTPAMLGPDTLRVTCLSRHLTRASIDDPTYSLYSQVYLFCISHPEKVKAYIKESGWAAQFERVGGSLEILSSSVCTSAGDVMRELDQLGLIERCVSSLLQQHNNMD